MKATVTGMVEPTGLALLCWLSPAFPVGAYAYSHGLEWAVEAGDVRDAASLRGWLGDLLSDGIGRNDAILLAAAWEAAAARDDEALDEANDLALALAPSAELRLETAQQGRSFLDAVAASWPNPVLAGASVRLDEIAYPVAVGLAAASHGIRRSDTVAAFLVALAQNLVSAGIRLAPIGQTAGQGVLASLLPVITTLAGEVGTSGLDAIGSATFRSDLGSLRHETQYTRLFRS